MEPVEAATGVDLSFEGLFGAKAPSFLGELERATPGYSQTIMSSPHSTTGQKKALALSWV